MDGVRCMVVKDRGIRSCHQSDAYLPITSGSVYGWRRMTRITDMHGDLKAESSGWLFKLPLAGGGAYCGGLIQAIQLVSLVTSLSRLLVDSAWWRRVRRDKQRRSDWPMYKPTAGGRRRPRRRPGRMWLDVGGNIREICSIVWSWMLTLNRQTDEYGKV